MRQRYQRRWRRRQLAGGHPLGVLHEGLSAYDQLTAGVDRAERARSGADAQPRRPGGACRAPHRLSRPPCIHLLFVAVLQRPCKRPWLPLAFAQAHLLVLVALLPAFRALAGVLRAWRLLHVRPGEASRLSGQASPQAAPIPAWVSAGMLVSGAECRDRAGEPFDTTLCRRQRNAAPHGGHLE